MDMDRELKIDASLLAQVRAMVLSNSPLAKNLKEVMQFRLVIDANYVISDLMCKIKRPQEFTAVEELIGATVFVIVAPRWLETEMIQSAIPKTAKKRKIAEDVLLAHWAEYRKHIVWDDSCKGPVAAGVGTADPKDVPYVMAQVRHDADGVLSNDKHIAKLGGTKLTLEFVLSVRRYARRTAVSVGIRISGMAIGMFTIGAVVEATKALAAAISKIPPPILIIAAFVLIAILLDPKARAWIKQQCAAFMETAGPFLGFVGEAILHGKRLIDQSEAEAAASLVTAKRHIADAIIEAGPLVEAARPKRRQRRTYKPRVRALEPVPT